MKYMKHLFTIFVICAAHRCIAQQHISKPDIKTDGLTGPVKTMLEKTGSIMDDSSFYETRQIYNEYNRDGKRVLYKFVYNVPQQKYNLTKHLYQGDKLLQITHYEDTALVEKKLYEYDKENHVTKEATYTRNGALSAKYLFSYNSTGHLTEMQLWSSDTYLALKQTYDNDARGNRLTLRNYNASNLLTYQYNYRYDGNNNKIQQTYQRLRDTVIQKTVNSYNNKKQLTHILSYNNKILVAEYSYSFHPNGNTAEVTSRFPPQQTKLIARHNDKGFLTESLEYKNNELSVRQTYWYEYDSRGNWTKRYNSYNGASPSLTIREISYY